LAGDAADHATRYHRGGMRPRELLGIVLVAACGSGAEPEPAPVTPPPSNDAAPIPDAAVRPCDDKVEAVSTGLAAHHPCRAWLAKTYARVVMLAPYGSGVVWSLDTERRTGLLLSAAHVFQFTRDVRFGARRGFVDPERGAAERWLACVPGASAIAKPRGPSVTMLYWPGSKTVPRYGWNTILPEDDFLLAALAGDLDASDCATATNGSADASFQIFTRPTGAPALDLAPTALPIAALATGTDVLVIGYPEGRPQTYSVARVLDDAQATRRVAELANAGDDEGVIPYSKRVEFLADGAVGAGPSGGGIFDRDGKLVGILVRGSHAGPPTIRAVRATYILEQLRAAWQKSPDKKLAGYLDRAITQ
jgi:hypothetical protein